MQAATLRDRQASIVIPHVSLLFKHHACCVVQLLWCVSQLLLGPPPDDFVADYSQLHQCTSCALAPEPNSIVAGSIVRIKRQQPQMVHDRSDNFENAVTNRVPWCVVAL